jgi:crotonobetainyl-CoA:carnitine CoA-transferase CaiB-like acyl-CoA transferase
MSLSAPLAGLTVVALEQAVAAPFCTARLADAGARVIKIERPEGDFARGYDRAGGADSSYFVWLNRGKESHVLDLAQAPDRARVADLLATADVFVQNLKPGAIARLGFGIETLRERHPRLICCSISGFGEDGPYAQRKAYDLLIQAEAGLAEVTGAPEAPGRVGISVVDIATGATAHAAILEALIARGITNEGADIRLSMFDVIAEWMTVPLLNHRAGTPPRRVGLAHPSIAPYGLFTASDGGTILLSVQSDREWRTLAAALLGDAALGTDPRFARNVDRVANRPETDGMVQAAIGACDRNQVRGILLAADIAFADVNDLAGLSAHPHLRESDVDTVAGPIRLPAPPALFDGVRRATGPVPRLGEHSARGGT